MRRHRAQLSDKRDAIYLRHHEIGEDQIWAFLLQQAQGFFDAVGDANFLAIPNQQFANNSAVGVVVVHNQDASWMRIHFQWDCGHALLFCKLHAADTMSRRVSLQGEAEFAQTRILGNRHLPK